MLGIVLFIPLLVSGPTPEYSAGLAVMLPRVHSGDEPHYLVQINSLLNDGDFDLANNYAAVHAGSSDAGRSFRHSRLDHHVTWYDDGAIVYWRDVFETERERWKPDSSGNFVPTRRPAAREVKVPPREYSQHPPGMAILLAMVLAPLRGTDWIEPAALVCSALVVFTALLWFLALIQPYAKDERNRYFVGIIAFFGTPAFAYGRTLFTEPYLMACAIGACYYYLRKSSTLLPGILLGLGMTMKPPFGVLLLPLLVDSLSRRSWSGFGRLCIGPSVAVFSILTMNYHFYGSCFRSSQRLDYGNFLTGAAEMLLHPSQGLLLFVPAVLIAALAIPQWFRRYPRDASILSLGVLGYFAVMAPWGTGGYCYGTRYLVPIIPFLLVPLCVLPETSLWKRTVVRRTAVAVCALSLMINVIGTLECGFSWSKPPLHFLFGAF